MVVKNRLFRIAGILFLGATLWFVPWLFAHLNGLAWWLSIPFALAMLMTVLLAGVTILNGWSLRVPPERVVPRGQEPDVLVVIPTAGEPPDMVYRTARSVLAQDYPTEKIRLVISDDSHRPAIQEVARRLQDEFPAARVMYYEPPLRGSAERRGDAKAGNLNAALEACSVNGPIPITVFMSLEIPAVLPISYCGDVSFIEMRDADDELTDPTFLRQAIGQLLSDPRAAFVQTIKEAVVGAGDSFNNMEPLFYRRGMLARNATNSVFPCGSGLVWRREALEDIGWLPVWNLVEDFQSGVEALRRGWRGIYLPIVGARGQIAPEDIPNYFKQRGTWALDTLRWLFWGRKWGLNFRQRLHFLELGLFYLHSFATLIFILTPVLALTLGIYPVVATHAAYALHFWPFMAAVELMLMALAGELPYESVWRSRQMWVGLTPVYIWAAILALVYGPKRKPVYRVTRKVHQVGLYWREILPQMLLFLALVGSMLYHLATHSFLFEADWGSLLWAAYFAGLLGQVIRNAGYGLPFGFQRVRGKGLQWGSPRVS
ncbi:MAG: glycosyltransferase [Anaerolineae bacterium]